MTMPKNNPLSAANYEARNEILATATPWQVAELINYLAKSLQPFCSPDYLSESEQLSKNPLFADLAEQPLTIKLYAIRSLTNTLERIYTPE